MHHRRVGDKVLTQESATLRWSASNADKISLDSSDSLESSGTRSIQVTPTQQTEGPVDQTFNYVLKATNTCGGSENKTVSIHLTGSIEAVSVPGITMNSIFFPTAYPQKDDPTVGLLRSQKDALTTLAGRIQKVLGL